MPASLLPLVPGFPLLGAVLLGLLAPRIGRRMAGSLACAFVALATLLAGWCLLDLARGGPPLTWMGPRWIAAGLLHVDATLVADPLSAAWAVLVTGVGLLIHVYSVGYLDEPADERRTGRYFALLNLFVAGMLLLVLADDLLLLFVGWEGVGLCSYLLIGFWYEDPANASAGRKAFLFNRVGDAAFLLGLAWLLAVQGTGATLGVTALRDLLAAHPGLLAGAAGTGIPLLLFAGATGKSAQIPLLGWLPDAMAGPTPVSALIHAATMVTAGVYLVCRLHFLFTPSPVAMGVVATVGVATALAAAFAALAQNDIKRVLAWSTISQLGFMFLAAGLGAFGATVFHVLTHGFFKALLFLAAGSVIHAIHAAAHHDAAGPPAGHGGKVDPQDLRTMGGLARALPWTATALGAGWLSIIGMPGTSGFFSKDAILASAFSAGPFGLVLGSVAVCAAWLTAFYMSRLTFLALAGTWRGRGAPPRESGPLLLVPLVTLATLSLLGGLLDLPAWLGGGALGHFLAPSLPAPPHAAHTASGVLSEVVLAAGVTLGAALGAWLAWSAYGLHSSRARAWAAAWPALHRVAAAGLHVDGAAHRLVTGPALAVARSLEGRWGQAGALAASDAVGHATRRLASWYGDHLQVGRVHLYALAIALGAAALVLAGAVR